jgi:hypothetical protein
VGWTGRANTEDGGGMKKGRGYQRDIFIGPEFCFTDTKNKKDSQGQTGVCRGKGGSKKMRPHVLLFLCFLILESKTKVIGADVILDRKWRTLKNDAYFFSCHFGHRTSHKMRLCGFGCRSVRMYS